MSVGAKGDLVGGGCVISGGKFVQGGLVEEDDVGCWVFMRGKGRVSANVMLSSLLAEAVYSGIIHTAFPQSRQASKRLGSGDVDVEDDVVGSAPQKEERNRC